MISDPLSPRVDIIIPTYNRAHLIETAVRAALEQSWWHKIVTVIDDASTDDTREALAPFFDRSDFNYIRLATNCGTAQAKNAGLLLTNADAVTFHDSDDIPDRDKVLCQVRALTAQGVTADECLNWPLVGRAGGEALQVGVAFTHHLLVMPDGQRVEIRRDLSMLDDVFPNLQMGARVPGEWTHINSGLFRREVIGQVGGFEDCIEEDREFRNRLILSGQIIQVIPELLLTKIETPDSLTQSSASDYQSPRRRNDRQLVWRKVEQWRKDGHVAPAKIDHKDLAVDFVSNPSALERRDVPMTEATAEALSGILALQGGKWIEAAE